MIDWKTVPLIFDTKMNFGTWTVCGKTTLETYKALQNLIRLLQEAKKDMKKKDLVIRLDKIYNDIDTALTDESVMTIGKVLTKHKDELGSLIQELEDEPDESESEKDSAQPDGD